MERGTRAKGARRSPLAAALTLPDEVTCDIFLRLPDKAILRCGAVCRAWRDVISTAVFLNAYQEQQPSLPLGIFHNESSSCGRDDVVDAAVDAFDLRGSPAKRQPVLRFNDYNFRRQFSVFASCDGLILLSLSNGLFYLCNPATRQWIPLPSLSSTTVVGLYPYGSSGEYRILHKEWRHEGDKSNYAYYVLTVGSSAEPRCLGFVDSLFAKPSLGHISSSPPVLLHDCLHWDEKAPNHGLIVFDTDAESFRCIRAPTPNSHVVEMDGLLGISHVNKTDMAVEIRVIQDYKTEVWSLKYKINLPVADMGCIAQKCQIDAVVVSKSGHVLVRCCSDRRMFHFDSNSKLLQMWDDNLPLVNGYWFRKSLCKHSFFRRQKGGRVKQLPRFFRGLL
ncbi:hypothetical protein U9M48_024859 [Paspalum notatum var. saurae]|uniref:F-box domain-containing protein n=1 Tax=Paspalum notatum var. saurae TaxID=547442 RepID=A0AAQ3WWK1_PASNO